MDSEEYGTSSSLEEARLRNIARNNDFLRSLFGSTEMVVAPEVKKQEQGGLLATCDRVIALEKLRSETVQSLTQVFPLRELEVRELVSFVTSDLQNSPALLVYGTSGSGKSALCNSVLHKLNVPHCNVSGNGFTGTRPFIVAMWDSIRDQLKLCRSRLQDKYSVSIPLGSMGRKAIKFADLSLSFGALVDRIFDSPQLELKLEPQEECFYVVVDGFHHIAAQDPVLATSLLNLSQHCHRRVKVIALCESVPPQAHLHHLVLRLPAYSELQLSSIIQGTLATQLETYASRKYKEGPSDREREVAVSAAQRWGLLKAPSSKSSGVGKRANQAAEEAVETVAGHLYQTLWPRVAETVKTSFRTTLNVALPILMCTSTHPTVLFDASIACFTAMYGSAPEELALTMALHYLHIAAVAVSEASGTDGMSGTAAVGSPAGRKSPRRSVNSSPRSPKPGSVRTVQGECPAVDERTLVALTAHYLPAAAVGGVRAAARLVHHLPAYSSAAGEVACLGKRKAVCLERPALVLPGGAEQAGGQLATVTRPRLASCELERIDTASMRATGWCLLCPIRVRYLIVAAFLAGHNPKETDNLKFVGEQAGKRRKQRAGSDKDVDLAAAGNKAAAKGGGALLIPRYFSLERLLSIYAQIVSIVEGRKPVGYGTASIYASVKTLVEKGLLAESGTWSLERPMYLSCVSFDTAQRLAQLMRFELQDFMYTKSSSYHTSSTL